MNDEERKAKNRGRNRIYYREHREKILEHKKNYYAANRERCDERHRRWREANKEKVRESERRWRRGEASVKRPLSQEEKASFTLRWNKIVKRDGEAELLRKIAELFKMRKESGE